MAHGHVLVCAACDPGCNGGCSQGFLDKSQLIKLAGLIVDITYGSNESIFFPEVGFTSPGVVTGWEFAARSEPLTPKNTQLPHIEIWRPLYTELEYYQIYSTSHLGVRLEKTDRYNVYRYMLDHPMLVEAGDVIGVTQPPVQLSQVSLALLPGTEPLYFLSHSARAVIETRLPLIVPQFLPLSKTQDKLWRCIESHDIFLLQMCQVPVHYPPQLHGQDHLLVPTLLQVLMSRQIQYGLWWGAIWGEWLSWQYW